MRCGVVFFMGFFVGPPPPPIRVFPSLFCLLGVGGGGQYVLYLSTVTFADICLK